MNGGVQNVDKQKTPISSGLHIGWIGSSGNELCNVG